MLGTLMIGGGSAGLSCALVLGSGLKKDFAKEKKGAIVTHQKTSHLQNALFYNVLGLKPETKELDILTERKAKLKLLYAEVIQIEKEKAKEIIKTTKDFKVNTNKNDYKTKQLVVAVGYTNLMTIKGLENYIKLAPKAVNNLR